MFQPAGDGRADQDDGQGEERQREEAAHAEQRVRRQAADGLAGLHSAGRQHPELDRGPHGRPSRHDEGDRIAGQLGGDDREPRLGPQGEALQANVQVKCAISAPIAARSHQGFRVDRRGQDANTSVIAGNTR